MSVTLPLSKVASAAEIAAGRALLQMPLGYDTLKALNDEHGDAFFVLEPARFRANFRALHGAFSAHYPNVRIGYSYKTNYTPQLCQIAFDEGGYAEVVSEMEYALAKRLGTPTPRIIFNGPYKAFWAFEDAAIGGAILNLDSIRDLGMLEAVAANHPNAQISAVLRCSLGPEGRISRFGFDPEDADFKQALESISALSNVTLKGLHCHLPDRDLASFEYRGRALVELAKEIFPSAPPELLNIGGGYFSNMPESLRATRSEPAATFDDYGRAIGTILSKEFSGLQKPPVLFLEPGTALVADTQTFYTRVISVKSIRGQSIATVSGSIFDISPNARSKNLPCSAVLDPERDRSTASQTHSIAGFTCIEGDILTEQMAAPLVTGDFIAYANTGSYSVVMRPPFILPSYPIILHPEAGGDAQLIKKRQSNEDVYADFIF